MTEKKKTRRVIILEGARIGFPNFQGRKDDINKNGARNCVVYFSDIEFARELAEEGWNIKFPEQPEGHDADSFVREPYLNITARYDNYPPAIYLVEPTTKMKELLTEKTVELIDTEDIIEVDLQITPSHWKNERTGEEGVKAYIKEMYVIVEPTPFRGKYNY